jgi:DNA-binding response OmpR family regulator
MKKIAIIEDDADLSSLLRYSLEQRGYQVFTSNAGEGAIEMFRSKRPDLVLLDIMLPGVDGIEVCRRMRADPVLESTPLIFLTARASETDRVLGLEMGANDYVVKPFSVRELLARIKVHLRDRPPEASVLKSGPLELNRGQCLVRLEGRRVPLTATEFRLLEHLMSYPGQVFPRDRLLDAVWGDRKDVLERTVDAYVVRLRNKLNDKPSQPRWIQSVRGIGYSFRPAEG